VVPTGNTGIAQRFPPIFLNLQPPPTPPYHNSQGSLRDWRTSAPPFPFPSYPKRPVVVAVCAVEGRGPPPLSAPIHCVRLTTSFAFNHSGSILLSPSLRVPSLGTNVSPPPFCLSHPECLGSLTKQGCLLHTGLGGRGPVQTH